MIKGNQIKLTESPTSWLVVAIVENTINKIEEYFRLSRS